MSCCSNSCYCESCPEAVPTINLTQVTNPAATWATEHFDAGDVGILNTLTLSNTPLMPSAVQAILNGVVLSQEAASPDYTVNAAVVTLGFTMNADDDLQFHYPY